MGYSHIPFVKFVAMPHSTLLSSFLLRRPLYMSPIWNLIDTPVLGWWLFGLSFRKRRRRTRTAFVFYAAALHLLVVVTVYECAWSSGQPQVRPGSYWSWWNFDRDNRSFWSSLHGFRTYAPGRINYFILHSTYARTERSCPGETIIWWYYKFKTIQIHHGIQEHCSFLQWFLSHWIE